MSTATGHRSAVKQISLAACIALSALFMGGCTTTLKDSAAIGDADLPELPAQAADAKAKPNRAQSGYVDPMVAAASEPTPEWSDAAAEATVADGAPPENNMAGLVTQPTGIHAGRASIFSTNPPQYGPEPGMEPEGEASEAQTPANQAAVASLVPQDMPTRGISPAFASVFSTPPGSEMPEETVEQPAPVSRPEAEAEAPPPAVEAKAQSPEATTEEIPAEPVLAPGVKKMKGSVLRRLHRRNTAKDTVASR